MPIIHKANPNFDNLKDVQDKFTGTICMHEGHPIYIKGVNSKMNQAAGQYEYILTVQQYGGKAYFLEVNDPAFCYRDFNLGYANTPEGRAFWFFRLPKRQWQQGLKRDQLAWLFAGGYAVPEQGFVFKRPYVDMMMNKYPSMKECETMLRNGDVTNIAFHKDFALQWDELHQDFILECKAKKVGVSLNGQLKEFRLLPDYDHLAESLQEAIA
jgi:hypothetical protein